MMENAARWAAEEAAYAAWRSRRTIRAESDRRCNICGRLMLEDEDYGGDCVFCMADAGDDMAIEHVERLVEKWKADTLLGPSG